MPQSLAKIYIHLVYSTKNRVNLIDEEIEKELFPYIAKIFRENDSPSLAINAAGNHVHSIFLLSRKVALCDVIEEVKKSSSKWIKTKGAQYKKFYWQNGYGAFSVSQSHVDAVKKYIARQKIHHRKRSFTVEYLELLEKYKVQFDERYVWD
jgi:putative transposase